MSYGVNDQDENLLDSLGDMNMAEKKNVYAWDKEAQRAEQKKREEQERKNSESFKTVMSNGEATKFKVKKDTEGNVVGIAFDAESKLQTRMDTAKRKILDADRLLSGDAQISGEDSRKMDEYTAFSHQEKGVFPEDSFVLGSLDALEEAQKSQEYSNLSEESKKAFDLGLDFYKHINSNTDMKKGGIADMHRADLKLVAAGEDPYSKFLKKRHQEETQAKA